MYSSCARQRPSPDASAEEAMDERRFDRLATMLGTGSRRVALRLTAATALAAVPMRMGSSPAAAKKTKCPKCPTCPRKRKCGTDGCCPEGTPTCNTIRSECCEAGGTSFCNANGADPCCPDEFPNCCNSASRFPCCANAFPVCCARNCCAAIPGHPAAPVCCQKAADCTDPDTECILDPANDDFGCCVLTAGLRVRRERAEPRGGSVASARARQLERTA
jgi:hypothetical protein